MTNLQLYFYDDKTRSIIKEYEIKLNLPSNFSNLAKSKDNDALIINTVKTIILEYLPRELEDPKRIALLSVLKQVHEHYFDVISEDKKVVYAGQLKKLMTEDTPEVINENRSLTELNLLDLLQKKELLETELTQVNKVLDKTLEEAWVVIDARLRQLKSIQEQWRTLSANTLGSKNLKAVAQISDDLKEFNSLDEGSNLLT
jgi:hypothetical protein